VPLQVLQQHGSGMEEVFAGRQTPKLRAVQDQLIADAQGHLRTAFALLATVPPQVRPVFLPLRLVARELTRMSRRTLIRSRRGCLRDCGRYGRCGGRRGSRELEGAVDASVPGCCAARLRASSSRYGGALLIRGPLAPATHGSRLCGAASSTLHRVRDTMPHDDRGVRSVASN